MNEALSNPAARLATAPTKQSSIAPSAAEPDTLHVLHFVSACYPTTGGTVTRLHNLLSDPINRHTMVLPAPSITTTGPPKTPLSPIETRDNLTIRRVDVRSCPTRLHRLPVLRHKDQARRLAAEAVRVEPHILHGHNPLACALAGQIYHARRRDVPFVYEAHGIMRDFSNIGRGWIPRRLASWPIRTALGHYERQVVRAARRIIVQTQSAKARLIHYYDLEEERIAVVPNGVDGAFFDPRPHRRRRTELRIQHGWDDRIVCLYAGYLDEVNGIPFLLDSIARLPAAARKKLRFVLIGRGPNSALVARATRQHPDLIQFLGVVEYREMPAYYAAADVFLIPRPSHPPAEILLPMKLLEAMAMEKLVIASNVAAMAEVVRHEENGLLFRKGDRDDFLRRLDQMIHLDDDREALGRQARRDATEHYSWQASRSKLQAVYNEVARNRTA